MITLRNHSSRHASRGAQETPIVWLDNSRIFAIIGVILLHVSAKVVLESNIGSGYWWIGNIFDSFARACIPLFVMISGALLLDPQKVESLSQFYTKRLSRVLIPLIFWSAFFLLWNLLKAIIQGEEVSIADLSQSILLGSPHDHMWFLYMILCLYLFTPFFRKVVTLSTRRELVLFVIMAFLLASLNAIAAQLLNSPDKLFTNWFLAYIPYFFLGHLIRTTQRQFPRAVVYTIFFLSGILTAVGCFLVSVNRGLPAGQYFYGYLSVTVIPMSICAMCILKRCALPVFSASFTRRISMLTFGIYLIHPVILESLSYAGFDSMRGSPLASIPIITLFVFATSLVGAWTISRTPLLKRVI